LVYNTLSSTLGADVVRANADKFIVPVKVCEGKIGRCRALDVALGIYYAINQPNVKVINLSVGNRIGSSLILEALEAANKKGVSVVISAGNQGENTAKPLSFPAAYNVSNASGKVLEDLIGVGSIRESANAGGIERFPSAFSSEGAWVDLVANGEGLRSSSAADASAEGEYTGTSFSAPQVSALAALVHAKNVPTSITPKDVKTFLLSKASAIPNCDLKKCGQGAVDPRSVLK
jgi:subtilisin family serine protease